MKYNNLVIVYEKNFTYHPYYQKSFKALIDNGINVFVFVKNKESKKLDNGIFQKTFKNKEDLIKQIKENYLEDSFFHTFEEHSIELINQLKDNFNQNFTKNYKAFINKDLQRNLLLKYDKSISVNFKEIDFEDLKNANTYLNFPFIIKPVSSAQSRGVSIIKNKEDLENYIKNYRNILGNLENAGYKSEKFLIEEFIDGKAFSCDYLVDEKGEFTIAKPIFLEFGKDWGIDDFCNISRIISKDVENMVDLKSLKQFIIKNIKALNIKNTFVHHEFKLTSKGEFKTIELNGRIGGFRLDMYDACYDINLLEYPFLNQLNGFDSKNLKTNYAIFAIYPKKEGIFIGINKNLVEKIKQLKSFESIRFIERKLGKKVGLSKSGYSRIGSIRLKNNNLDDFNKDYNFIRKIYFDLVKIND